MFHPAPYGIYAVADGYVALSLSPLSTLAEALGWPEKLEPYRATGEAQRRRAEITRAVAALLADRPRRELIDTLRAAGVWCAPVNDYTNVESDPAVRHLRCFGEFQHPRAGRVRTVNHPIRYSDGEPELRFLPPEVGQQTVELLEELGYSPGDIERFVAAAAASAPDPPARKD
jgi:crotonobetainyl-CoA:carnitine CoA-transferase CaiB-like acyl-CoA transferase